MPYVRRMDHVGVVVEDLQTATEFFLDLGLEREYATSVQGEWVDNVIGLKDVQADVVVVRTPDGSGKLELSRFSNPEDDEGPHAWAANRLGIRHISFLVDDLNAIVDTLVAKGTNLVGKIEEYEHTFRLCYIRGPEGIIVELAERVSAEATS